MVLGHLLHNFGSGKLLVVVHEYGRPGKPLTVHLTPYGLAPARVGHREVQAVGREGMPEHASGQVAQGVKEVVRHHLRLAARATREVHQHGVVVGVDMCGPYKGRRLGPLGRPVVKTSGHLGANAYQSLHRGALGHSRLYLAYDIGVAGTYDGLDAGPLVTIYDVVGRQHVCGGYGYGPQLMQRQHGEPPLVVPFEY